MRRLALAAAGGLVLTASLTAVGVGTAAASARPTVTHKNVHVCGAPAAGFASCDAIRHDVYKNGRIVTNLTGTTPKGYVPNDLKSAYGLGTGTGGAGKTIAIVDAYDDPTAVADVNHYRAQFGITALGTCTSMTQTSACIKKVNQNGSTSPLPKANGGWAQEISLDLDMVSAACPNCNILLVEASSASFANLGAAVQTAGNTAGVVAISNSYGGSDAAGTSYPQYEAAAAKGIAVTASTGDSGYGAQSPASFTDVIAVGGTNLKKNTSARGWVETAWTGAGSGCSTLNAAPGYQNTATTQCGTKMAADVSSDADPNTGVAVYDSTSYQGLSGWLEFGGTSASSPFIASLYGLAGLTPSAGSYAGGTIWAKAGSSSLNDAAGNVSNAGRTGCSPTLWCTSVTGYDGPTGLGTPNGTAAF